MIIVGEASDHRPVHAPNDEIWGVIGYSKFRLGCRDMDFRDWFLGYVVFCSGFWFNSLRCGAGRSVAGISFGVVNMLSNIGTFVSPIIVGYILDLTGNFFLEFAAVGSIGLLGVLGAIILRAD